MPSELKVLSTAGCCLSSSPPAGWPRSGSSPRTLSPLSCSATGASYAAVVGSVFIVRATLAAFGVSYDALWPPALVLVAALAARSMNDDPGLLRGRALAWLGELSYAIYLVHAIVLMVVFFAAKFLGLADSLGHGAVLGGLSFCATFVAAQAAYTLVEKPGRTIMARLLLPQDGRGRIAKRRAV